MKRLHISDLRDALVMMALFAIMTLAGSLALAGCGSDEPGGGGSAGTSATGGMGGAAGNGGTSATGGTSIGGAGGEAGTPGNVWKKGVIGKAGEPRVIMKNGGPILGISLQDPMLRTLDGELDGGEPDAETLPPVIPKVDFGTTSPSSDLHIFTPPYLKLENEQIVAAEPPYAVTYSPNGDVTVDQHFPNWRTDWTIDCFIPHPVNVNGLDLQTYTGVTFDVETKLNRYFFATSADDAVYELRPGLEPKILAQGFGLPSSLMAHPQGFLVVTTLPGYVKNAPLDPPPELPVKLFKIAIDEPHAVTEIAALPIPADYENITSCYEFGFTPYGMPTSFRIPVALKEDGSYWIGDVGARSLYKVSSDGQTVEKIANMPLLVVALISAPNDILYMVTPPILGNNGGTEDPDYILKGVTIYALNEVSLEWEEVIELTGYDGHEDDMSFGKFSIPCPDEYADAGVPLCKQPVGVYFKVIPDVTPLLFVSDPITARLFEIPLDMGEEPDAGLPEAGDDAETGTAGTSGSAGSAGTAGASGTAGSAPQSAPYPPAEAPAHEPMAETPENTSPWVWFALLGALGAATLAGLGLRRR